jgi:hypothetical protein
MNILTLQEKSELPSVLERQSIVSEVLVSQLQDIAMLTFLMSGPVKAELLRRKIVRYKQTDKGKSYKE